MKALILRLGEDEEEDSSFRLGEDEEEDSSFRLGDVFFLVEITFLGEDSSFRLGDVFLLLDFLVEITFLGGEDEEDSICFLPTFPLGGDAFFLVEITF